MADLRAQIQEGLSGSYALERELGRGGMATVFLARDLKHDRPVALKVLHPELAASMGPERFQREIRLAARLQHPHVLTVLDSGQSGRRGVERSASGSRCRSSRARVSGNGSGGSGSSRSRTPSASPARPPRRCSTPTSKASSTATSSPRTCSSPATATRSWRTSASREHWAAAGDDRLTETGLAVGTPAYMSPEQAAGDKGLDARTDVYSLAAVLYEMLAGQPPYVGATTQALMVKRLTEPPPSIRAVRPNVSEGMDLAIRKALAPVPADRFGSAAELARALAPTARGGGRPSRLPLGRYRRPQRRARNVRAPPRSWHSASCSGSVCSSAGSAGTAPHRTMPAGSSGSPCSPSTTSARRRTSTSPTASPTRSGASSRASRAFRSPPAGVRLNTRRARRTSRRSRGSWGWTICSSARCAGRRASRGRAGYG